MTKYLPAILVLLLGAAAVAVAAQQPEPASTTTVAAASKPPVLSQPKSPRAADELLQTQEAIGDFAADFSLTIYGAAANGADTKAQGKMWATKGRKYAVWYDKPERQKLVSDGSKRWLYLEKINQVQIQSLPPAGNPAEFFLELGGGLPALIKRCEVKRLPGGKPGETGFELTPKAGETLTFQQARVWLSGSQWLPTQAVVEAGRRVKVEFRKVKIHTAQELLRDSKQGLPAATFTFQPPADAEVIQLF